MNNIDAIKLLNKLEVGIPLIVKTTWQGLTMRKVSLYAGTDGSGTYNFIDDTGVYKMTTGYIKEHCTISQELDQDEDLFEVVKLIDKVKGDK